MTNALWKSRHCTAVVLSVVASLIVGIAGCGGDPTSCDIPVSTMPDGEVALTKCQVADNAAAVPILHDAPRTWTVSADRTTVTSTYVRDGKKYVETWRVKRRCQSNNGACSETVADCAVHPACRDKGYCAQTEGICFAQDDASCKSSAMGCNDRGKCAMRGSCVAESAECCAATNGCTTRGDCDLVGDDCRPTSQAHCQQSAECKSHGKCALNPQSNRCIPTTQAHCSQSTRCQSHGACSLRDSTCGPADDEDCEKSDACKQLGHCEESSVLFTCYAQTPSDCSDADVCKKLGACKLTLNGCSP